MKSWIALAFIASLASPAAAKPKQDWKAFADCAAAYQVNAAVKDPSRPATMSGDMAEIGADYQKAAIKRRGQAVDDRIKAQASRFRTMTREQLDKVIDACPQLDD